MRPYYEGWYMKQQQGGDILAVIPGRAQDEAFIQVVTADGAHYLPFPLEDFRQTGTRSMRVGRSLFSPIGMMLDVRAPGLELVGRLRYRELTPLRSDIMGPFAYLPMETKHTVFSMRHRVDGEVELNGRTLRFENAKGYMEGDRGHSFPRGYTWIQSTDFGCAASVMLALAEIPLAGLRFTGCIGVVWIAGVEHRFATYRGGRIREASDTAVEGRQGDMTPRGEPPEAGAPRRLAPPRAPRARPPRRGPAVPARFRFVKGGRTLLDSPDACTSFELVAP